jgi:transcriptional regulator with XRE-family HTH domain
MHNGRPIDNIGKLVSMEEAKESRERTPFGQRMHDARLKAGLTQVQVREALGISQGTLSQLERTSTKSGRVAEFARLYGCDPHWLATGEGITPAAGAPPPKPPRDFSDRHTVSDSDWALLQEIKDMEASPALARRLQELRAELAERMEFAENVYRHRVEAAQHTGGNAGGMSVFGDLDDAPAPPAAHPKRRRGGAR